MHEAGAAVAGGSLRAVEAILRGEIEHAFHPGGGLHHAMPDRASGFCIYDDPALAIARAREAGRRVLYLDFDVHHGDGVQVIHSRRPRRADAVVPRNWGATCSRGRASSASWGRARRRAPASTCRSSPGPASGRGWRAVESLVPAVAAAFGPDFVVSQHGADSHAWDPLAHLRVTTTAMGAAARLDGPCRAPLHEGRRLALDRRRRLRRVPGRAPGVEPGLARRRRTARRPADARGVARALGGRGRAVRPGAAARAVRRRAERRPRRRATSRTAPSAGRLETVALVRRLCLPAIVRAAEDRGWWNANEELARPRTPEADDPADGASPRFAALDAAALDRLRLVHGALPVAGAGVATALARRRPAAARRWSAAVDGDRVVGLAIGVRAPAATRRRSWRSVSGRAGAGRASAARCSHRLLDELPGPVAAEFGVAERDPVHPLPVETRARIARSLLEGAAPGVTGARTRLARRTRPRSSPAADGRRPRPLRAPKPRPAPLP